MKEKRTKKKIEKAVPEKKSKLMALLGFLSAAALFFYPLQLIKYFIYKSNGSVATELQWKLLFPSLTIDGLEKLPLQIPFFASLVVPLLALFYIETSAFITRKAKAKASKMFLLFFQFSIITFLLFHLFLFILNCVFSIPISREWEQLLLTKGYNFQERAVLAFIVTFIIFGYQSLALARLTNLFSNHNETPLQRIPHEQTKK
ncbi:MAG: hypothetical protein HYV28_00085 [Ignavibacteriales bacterium]|nr:hypothetical protein [Ignavibacteriales bacterium]